MNLYHFSDEKLSLVKPQLPQHGFMRDWGLPVSYWYSEPRNFELGMITGAFLYRAEIEPGALYDIGTNILRLPLGSIPEMEKVLKFLRRSGFQGVRKRMSGYTQVMLFHSVGVVRVKRRGNHADRML